MTSPLPGSAPFFLVGRDRELAVLQEHLSAARAGHGSLVLIGGEAGIGKTALAETVCRDAVEQGALVLVGRCFDLTETPPYGPWVELFGRYRRSDGMPPLPDAFAERGTVGAVASQSALFRQVLDFLTALGASRPLLLLVDDLHWADAASLDLLRFITRSIDGLPLLIVVTYRSDELTRRHPLHQLLPILVREAGAERLDVRALDNAAIDALVAGRYHLPAADAERLVAHLQVRAEGNALFVGEMLRSLEETGALWEVDGQWVLGELTEAAIPPLLRAVIDARIARLSDVTQLLLRVAAVIGHAAPFRLWAMIAGTDEDALVDAVDEADAAHVMAEASDGDGAIFVHALLREAIYEGIRPSQRRRWHRQAGEALAAQPQSDPDAVASHFRQAHDERATAWLIRAGDRAQRAYAWPTAVARFEAALALMEQHGVDAGERGWLLYRLANLKTFSDTPQAIAEMQDVQRLATEAGDALLAAHSLVKLGNHRCLNGYLRQGLADLAAGVNAFGALSAAHWDRLGAFNPVDRLDVGQAWGRLCLYRANAGYYRDVLLADEQASGDRAADWARNETVVPSHYRALGMAHAALGQPDAAQIAFARERTALRAVGDDLEAGLSALNELRYVALTYHADDLSTRRSLAGEAEVLYRRAGGHRPRLPAERGRLPLMVIEGQWDEADAVARAVLAVGGHGAYIGNAQNVFAALARERGDLAAAHAILRDVLPAGSATPAGDLPWFRDYLILLRVAALLAMDANDLITAHSWLDAYDRWIAWSETVLGRAEGALGWAEYYRATGNHAESRRRAENALAHAGAPRQPLALLAAHRLLGDLAMEAREHLEAEAHLNAALALADACAAPYERALTLLAFARLAQAAGQEARARTMLDVVRAICIPLGAKRALDQVDTLSEHLKGTATSSAAPAGLTPREVEVLRLLADGKTNREIADTLFLSEHTVHVHVRNIFTKTRTDNRTEAAAFALRLGIA